MNLKFIDPVRLDWPVNPRDLPVSASPVQRIFWMQVLGKGFRFPCCVANPLPTEPSLKSQTQLKEKEFILIMCLCADIYSKRRCLGGQRHWVPVETGVMGGCEPDVGDGNRTWDL